MKRDTRKVTDAALDRLLELPSQSAMRPMTREEAARALAAFGASEGKARREYWARLMLALCGEA